MSCTYSGWTPGSHLPAWVHWYLAPRLSGRSIILWWEKRRFAYNAILFAWGAAQCGAMVLIDLAFKRNRREQRSRNEAPVWAMVVFGFYLQLAANLWYTGGWVVEALLQWALGRHLVNFSSRALLGGTIFSLVFAEIVYLIPIMMLLDDL